MRAPPLAWLLSCLSIWLSGCDFGHASIQLGTQTYSSQAVELRKPVALVPLVPHSGQVMVEVEVNGHGPYHFTVDTGASLQACVDLALKDELALPVVGETNNSDGSGTSIRREMVGIESIELGGLVFEDLRAIAADYRFVGRRGDPRVMGILGFELFRKHLLTIDYPNKELRLSRGGLPPPADNHVISYSDSRGAPYIKVRIGSRRIDTLIDTGFPGGLSLPDRLMDKLELEGRPRRSGRVRSVNSKSLRAWDATLLKPVEFAGHRFEEPRVAFFESHKSAYLGAGMMASYAVTFDQKRRRVHFQPGESGAGAGEDR